MKKIAMVTFIVLTLAIPAIAKDKSTASYLDSFFVRYMAQIDGCNMVLTKDHIAYNVIDGFFPQVCFNVGQTIKGRIVDNRIEILYTDSKWKQKVVKYQIVTQRVF
ncbi:MAG: hypothetical protein WCF54_08135 [Terracidiphilus sp.]